MNRKKISAAMRHKIHEMYGGRCAYCGQPVEYKDMQVDHIVPLHRGGEDGEGNYYPACRACNYYKHTLTVEDFRREIGEIKRRFRARNFRYRMALKYGIISETENEIRFYFEKITRRDTCDHKSHDDE